MKLYRLINSDDKLTFDGDIQGNVILEPNSKVALLSANWKNIQRQIKLDTGNNEVIVEMNFTPNTSHTYKFNLEEAIYTTETNSVNELLQNFQNLLNASMNYVLNDNEKALGLKWNCVYSESSNLVTISTAQQELIDPIIAINDLPFNSSEKFIENNIKDVDGNNKLYKSNNTNPAEVYSRTFEFPISYDTADPYDNVSTMNAVWQCSINELSAGALGGIIGIMGNPALDRSSIANYEYGITWTNLNTEYGFIRNGTLNPSGITPNIVTDSDDNDFLQIRMSNNKIEVVIYNNNTVPKEQVILSEIFSNYSLFPSLYLRDDETTIKNFSSIPIFNTIPLDVIYKTLETNFDVIEPYINPIIWEINMSFDLKEFLGFEFSTLPGDKDNFKATSKKVRVYEGSDAYIIEMNNIQLDSYDTQQQQRKSILNVITNENNNENFRYEASNPIFIDINNNFPIPLRNLNLKVLTDKYQEIENDGNANLVILFD